MPRKITSEPPKRAEIVVQAAMEDVMHDSMMPYSEHVILERALPRVEDGLKPVQRRILFTMHELGTTPDKPHRKCARIVGDCLGKYHPHGDSSVYDALARMAQPFALRDPLVDGHGNFGSIDGDSPAAMRYTEARMTPLALLLLRDIEKDTVDFRLNFDDTQKEPDMLPSYFPNLLVNGANGIAVGLATNIPPHNLGETIDGVIALLRKPDLSTRELMKLIPAPDFPTGGILACDSELYSAYETGRGKLSLRAKAHIEEGSAGRKLIVVTEVPYQVNKAAMLEKILRLSEEKKTLFSGIYDIRDESDRTGMRAVVEVRKDADAVKILNALYKYSDLQVTFGVNMVAIADGKPAILSLRSALSYYIRHQKDVVTRRTRYDLAQAEARAHILEGLIVAVDHLDEVIALIRKSKNPKEAKQKLMERFALSEIQAQAILDMRLQRLTNLEIVALRKEYADLQSQIAEYKSILASEAKLVRVIETELLAVKAQYATPRRTELAAEFGRVVIETESPEAEEAVVLLTRAGFFKRMPPKSFVRGDEAEAPLFVLQTDTSAKLLLFTNLGQMHSLPVIGVPECRPKDRGAAPASLIAGLQKDERIVRMTVLRGGDLIFFTQRGMAKRASCEDFDVRKGKIAALSLKDGDELVFADWQSDRTDALLFTKDGMSIHFPLDEIPTQGRAAAGVRGITLAVGDEVRFALLAANQGEVVLATDRGYLKRCPLLEFDPQARGGKGQRCVAFQKNGATGSCLAGALLLDADADLTVRQKNGEVTTLSSSAIRISSRTDRGELYIPVLLDDVVLSLE